MDDVYNVASGDRDDAAGALAGDAARDRGVRTSSPEFHPPRKVNPVPRRLADTTRAREELGFVADGPAGGGPATAGGVAARAVCAGERRWRR